MINTGSILFIFLDSNSKFRDTYYECLTILSVFFGISYIDLVISSSCQSDSDDNTEEKIYRVWQYITFIISNILTFITLVTTLVFAGQAIRKHATIEQPLKQYDFGVYIYLLVNCAILSMQMLGNCCAGISKMNAQKQ